ncbi:MAG: hypothetical protein M3Y74_10115 [Chloroflexota bacterium]|nr:hypothetical protein [Chloroflexota bacterium]
MVVVLSLEQRQKDLKPSMNSASIFRALVDAQAEVVVIGGWAAVVQGVSHVTNDIDLCYNPTPDNRRKLVQAIAPLKPFLRVGRLTADEARMLPFVWDERTLRDSPNVTLQTDIGDLDLLMSIPGVGDYAHVRAAAKPLDVLGITIPVLDLPALLMSKRATGRPKDQQQIPLIEAALLLRESEQ